MNLCKGYKLSNEMKLRKDKFWNEELKMSKVRKAGAISNTTVGKSDFQDYIGHRVGEYAEI